jgi:excisionase family DNA binding protein
MKSFNGVNMYTVRDLSEKFGVSQNTIVKYLREGRIRGQKIGQSWYITEENLGKFLRGE